MSFGFAIKAKGSNAWLRVQRVGYPFFVVAVVVGVVDV